jgi:endonuclease YncB( thermonuclease family)
MRGNVALTELTGLLHLSASEPAVSTSIRVGPMSIHSPTAAIISWVAASYILLAGHDISAAEVISGVPRIVDGDTVQIGQTKIRLEGIDAPETDQLCLDAKGDAWACGVASRDKLITFSNNRAWDCDIVGSDRYGRSLGKCFVEGDDISQWLVRSGLALSFTRYSHEYDQDETAARENRAGLWAGAFIAPWDWRHRNTTTIVLGSISVPVDAQKKLLGAVSAQTRLLPIA